MDSKVITGLSESNGSLLSGLRLKLAKIRDGFCPEN